MIKAVLFDFDQTLVDSTNGFRFAEKQAQKNIFEDINTTSWDDFLSFYRRLRKQFHRASNLSRKALWEEVCRHFGRPFDSFMLEKWEDDYWLTVKALTALFPETLSTLESLARHYKLAALTNTQAQADPQKHRLIETPQLTVFFETVIVAGEAGVPPKPDRSVFLMCLETLSLDPGQAVYIGDDWHADICGAADAGIQPIWIKHHRLSRSWPQPDREISVPVITSLDSLLDIDSIIS
ncbi:HAD family hydrolase [Planctomycetota bacterium]